MGKKKKYFAIDPYRKFLKLFPRIGMEIYFGGEIQPSTDRKPVVNYLKQEREHSWLLIAMQVENAPSENLKRLRMGR